MYKCALSASRRSTFLYSLMAEQKQIRNVAIIAHVDHGKTTLVDALLKQSHTFHDKAAELSQELIMDSNELERERGITILAKNTAVEYKGVKINIIDTPGHADFGGEVERTLHMADGCLLIIDAQEGPMSQTRFVLQKAFALGLKVIVVINKIDKKFARVSDVIKETHTLFLDLATQDTQLEFPTLYAISRRGAAFYKMPAGDLETITGTVEPIFETILKEIPPPKNDSTGSFQMLITALDYDDYKGKYAIGRIQRGVAKPGMQVVLMKPDGAIKTRGRIERVYISKGLGRVEVDEAFAGDIVSVTGIADVGISETIADVTSPEALPAIAIEEPTLKIALGANTSPFAGQDGKFLTGRQLEERLRRELETNVSLRMEVSDKGDFILSGRGELHLSILIETLRREGYEFQVGRPEVIIKMVDGSPHEPIEEVVVDVPEAYAGVIAAEFGKRKAVMKSMHPHVDGYRYTFEMPTRALLGLRSVLMAGTRGTVVLNSMFLHFAPRGEDLPQARAGVLVAHEAGSTVAYGLEIAEGRGTLFVGPGTPVYEGMIVGENSRDEDLDINVCKEKKLTNVRASATDAPVQLVPPRTLSLEEYLDYIGPDEFLEVTPKNLRLRKIYLSKNDRKRNARVVV
jgi:GTP-binding protein